MESFKRVEPKTCSDTFYLPFQSGVVDPRGTPSFIFLNVGSEGKLCCSLQIQHRFTSLLKLSTIVEKEKPWSSVLSIVRRFITSTT